MSEDKFCSWIDKAKRDGATWQEIVRHIKNFNMSIPNSFTDIYDSYNKDLKEKDEVEYWKQLFYKE